MVFRFFPAASREYGIPRNAPPTPRTCWKFRGCSVRMCAEGNAIRGSGTLRKGGSGRSRWMRWRNKGGASRGNCTTIRNRKAGRRARRSLPTCISGRARWRRVLLGDAGKGSPRCLFSAPVLELFLGDTQSRGFAAASLGFACGFGLSTLLSSGSVLFPVVECSRLRASLASPRLRASLLSDSCVSIYILSSSVSVSGCRRVWVWFGRRKFFPWTD